MSNTIIISYFDSLKGPINFLNIFSKENIKIPKQIIDKVTKLLDLFQNEQFFTQSVDNYNSANYYFKIPSKWARGQNELVLLTFLKSKDESFIETIESVVKNLSAEILSIPDIFKAFYVKNTDRDSMQTRIKYDQLKDSCKEFSINLPEIASFSSHSQQKKLILLGLASTGKTSLLNYMKNKVFIENTTPTIIQNLVKFVFNNLNLICYDLPGHEKFRNLWKTFLPNSSIIVFIIDSSNPNINNARVALDFILSFVKGNLENTPLLIVFNKQDLSDAQHPNKLFSLLKLTNTPIKKIIPLGVSAKTGEGVEILLETITSILIS
ncbi:MAG: GTPase HflX [Candidatus Heimdallarchaeota archaeon LC_3]|nr:MAG: GTPase HflX [Candidatus Heimdallarchaeota archaeon LC_3]